jgi:hypothetical protein
MVKCVFCNIDILDNRSMEICDKCGISVWGLKQWNNIKKTTDEARDKGDLCLFKEQEENPDRGLKDILGKGIISDVDAIN